MSWIERIHHELIFSVSRSGGPGGQNVNKVSSKVTVKFNVMNSQALTEEEKNKVLERLGSKMSSSGELVLTSQESRSQLDNKKNVLEKLEKLLSQAFQKKKKRVATKRTKAANQKRLKGKKEHSEKKKWRQGPSL